MKSSDIKIGEAYAWGTQGYSKPQKVVVVEVGVRERPEGLSKDRDRCRVYATWSNVVERRVPGVLVETETDGRYLIPSRKIRSPWADYVAEAQREEAFIAQRKAERIANRAIADKLVGALRSNGIETGADVYETSTPKFSVHLDREAQVKLTELLDELVRFRDWADHS